MPALDQDNVCCSSWEDLDKYPVLCFSNRKSCKMHNSPGQVNVEYHQIGQFILSLQG